MAANKVAPVVTGSVTSTDGGGEGRSRVGSRDGSHAVISAGTTSGWAGDSFRRYSEYRLCSELWSTRSKFPYFGSKISLALA
jgi:hypothetical protein